MCCLKIEAPAFSHAPGMATTFCSCFDVHESCRFSGFGHLHLQINLKHSPTYKENEDILHKQISSSVLDYAVVLDFESPETSLY